QASIIKIQTEFYAAVWRESCQRQHERKARWIHPITVGRSARAVPSAKKNMESKRDSLGVSKKEQGSCISAAPILVRRSTATSTVAGIAELSKQATTEWRDKLAASGATDGAR